MPVPEAAYITPQEMAAQDPQVQIMAIQNALQQIGASPEAAQMIPQMSGGDSNGGIVDAEEVHARG